MVFQQGRQHIRLGAIVRGRVASPREVNEHIREMAPQGVFVGGRSLHAQAHALGRGGAAACCQSQIEPQRDARRAIANVEFVVRVPEATPASPP